MFAPLVDGETILVVHVDPSRVSLEPIAALIGRFVPDAAEKLSRPSRVLPDSSPRFAASTSRRLSGRFARRQEHGSADDPWWCRPTTRSGTSTAFRTALQIPPQVDLSEAIQSVAGGPRALTRPELADALAAAGDAAVQVVLIPPASSRRVVEELDAAVAAREIGGGSITVLTHGISWAALAIDLSPMPALRLTIKSQDAASAEALRARWLDGMKLAGRQKEVRQVLPDFDKVTVACCRPSCPATA